MASGFSQPLRSILENQSKFREGKMMENEDMMIKSDISVLND